MPSTCNRTELGLLVNVPQSVLDEATDAIPTSSATVGDGRNPIRDCPFPARPLSFHSFRPRRPALHSCSRTADHALGVAFWAVPRLFRHSSAIFNRQRQSGQRKEEESADELMRCTRTLLLINPDNATAWNARKRMMLSASQSSPSPSAASAELGFLSFLFSKHPKSSEAWAHRRWTCTAADGGPGRGSRSAAGAAAERAGAWWR